MRFGALSAHKPYNRRGQDEAVVFHCRSGDAACLGCVHAGNRTPDEPPETAAASDPCGAARYSHLIGQTSPTITVPEGQMYRIAREGQPMTMELIQDRLTFIVDKRGKLMSVSCS
ncbi:I78 family peptidase inhibitor [Paracoccus kondratievae]